MIIVTGGLGFIGNELVRQLKSGGNEVVIVDNRNRVAPDILDINDIPVYEIDIVDKVRIDRLFRDLSPEMVFHLAAIHYIPECNENPERTLKVNVEGTQSILRASSEAGVKKVIFASSGAVYADSSDPLSESSKVAPVDIYGWSKLFGENLCRLNHALYGTPVVICRLFNNYGPRETNLHIIPEIIRQLRNGDEMRLGNISTVRDYIHTSDCARSLINTSLIPVREIEILNVATGRGYTVAEIIKIIAEITGRSIRVQEEKGRMRKFDKQIQLAGMRKMFDLTGWVPERSIRDGLSDLLTYEKIF